MARIKWLLCNMPHCLTLIDGQLQAVMGRLPWSLFDMLLSGYDIHGIAS